MYILYSLPHITIALIAILCKVFQWPRHHWAPTGLFIVWFLVCRVFVVNFWRRIKQTDWVTIYDFYTRRASKLWQRENPVTDCNIPLSWHPCDKSIIEDSKNACICIFLLHWPCDKLLKTIPICLWIPNDNSLNIEGTNETLICFLGVSHKSYYKIWSKKYGQVSQCTLKSLLHDQLSWSSFNITASYPLPTPPISTSLKLLLNPEALICTNLSKI